MSFLKPEQKPSLGKMVTHSWEFRQFLMVGLMCLIFIGAALAFVYQWKKMYPNSAQAQTNNNPPPGREEVIPIQITPESEPITPASSSTPVSPTATPGVITPTITPSAPVISETLYRLAVGRLEGVKDYEIESYPAVTEDEYFISLLSEVAKLKPEEISQKVSKISYRNLIKYPEKYRGAIIRVEGLLLDGPANTYRDYQTTNPAGVKIYYPGTLIYLGGEDDKDEHYFFHLIDRPNKKFKPKSVYQNPDTVVVEGAFLKIVRLPMTGKVPHRDAVFLIGRKMDYVDITLATKGISQLQLIFGGIIILAGLGIIIMIIRSGRKDKLYEQQRMERWKKKVEERPKNPPPPAK